MAGDANGHGLAAGAKRAAQLSGQVPPRRRTGPVHWLVFNSACVAISVTMMWLGPVVPLPGVLSFMGFLLSVLLIPMALLLVPVFWLRRVPRKKRKVAWELIIVLIAAVGLAFLTYGAGEEWALQERGRWTKAVVVKVEDRKSDKCTLRTSNGQDITPLLGESDGCDAEVVEPGDDLTVLYDPKGAAGPADEMPSGSYAGVIVGLAALIIAAGTCGCVRMNRWDNAYTGGTP
ncbi:hypothetical protein ABZ840_00095 [Streptomyces sp. NPDC047117]|uniref:hypothetical protein n=1 Tax=Streptomyces sp. NPDC047117 TaxID=3155379 RepID=UPI00340FE401